jgi:hypothetical protein
MKLQVKKSYKSKTEALGLPRDDFVKFLSAAARYFHKRSLIALRETLAKKHDHTIRMHEDGPEFHLATLELRPIDIMGDFLESDEAKKLKWRPDNANGFFLVGMSLPEVEKVASEMTQEWVTEKADEFFHSGKGHDHHHDHDRNEHKASDLLEFLLGKGSLGAKVKIEYR